MYVGAKGKASAAALEYRRQKSDRLGVRESVADPLLARVRGAYCQMPTMSMRTMRNRLGSLLYTTVAGR